MRDPKPFGIVCAIPEEYEAIAGKLTNAVHERGPQGKLCRGLICGRPVVVSTCGIGKVNAALATTLLSERWSCESIVFSGVAGGVDPSLNIGDVVIADHVIQHDYGIIENNRFRPYQTGHVPFINPTDRLGYSMDEGLKSAIKTSLSDFEPSDKVFDESANKPAAVRFGTVVSGDQFINCDRTRRELFDTYRASAVEMEGGVIGQLASILGFRWIVIRTLSDLAGGDAKLDFAHFVKQVSQRSANLVAHLIPRLDAALLKVKS